MRQAKPKPTSPIRRCISTRLAAINEVYVAWAGFGFRPGFSRDAAAQEVENPGKNIPRALVYGMLAVIALYVLANFVYLRVLGITSVAHSPHVASDAFEMLVGERGAKWLTIAMMISALGALHVNILTAARIPFAMARDGLFFKFAERVQPTFRTPRGVCKRSREKVLDKHGAVYYVTLGLDRQGL